VRRKNQKFSEITLPLSFSFTFFFLYNLRNISGHFASFSDTRKRSKDRSNATARSRRSRKCRHGRTGLRRWSGTTSCSLPFRRFSTYLPITRTIRTRVRRWAIRTCPRPTRNMHIATCLASRRGRITCRSKRGKRARYFSFHGAERRNIVESSNFLCISERRKNSHGSSRTSCKVFDRQILET